MCTQPVSRRRDVHSLRGYSTQRRERGGGTVPKTNAAPLQPRAILTAMTDAGATTDSARLRGSFDEDAELYDRARPGYPAALFDDLDALAELPPGARVLEIGC